MGRDEGGQGLPSPLGASLRVGDPHRRAPRRPPAAASPRRRAVRLTRAASGRFSPPPLGTAPRSGGPTGPRSPGRRLPLGPRPGACPWGEAAPRRMRAGLPRPRPAPPPGRPWPAETLPPPAPSCHPRPAPRSPAPGGGAGAAGSGAGLPAPPSLPLPFVCGRRRGA